jgi:hypothetical protein
MTPKWVQRMMAMGIAPEVIQERVERRRLKEREWSQKNKDRKKVHKKLYRARKKIKDKAPPIPVAKGDVITNTYRANWKEAPVYQCTELNYRGKTT